jgi:hypothetical protein
MLTNDAKRDTMFYCPWSKQIIKFNAEILWHIEIPFDIKNLKDYETRAKMIGGEFIK